MMMTRTRQIGPGAFQSVAKGIFLDRRAHKREAICAIKSHAILRPFFLSMMRQLSCTSSNCIYWFQPCKSAGVMVHNVAFSSTRGGLLSSLFHSKSSESLSLGLFTVAPAMSPGFSFSFQSGSRSISTYVSYATLTTSAGNRVWPTGTDTG